MVKNSPTCMAWDVLGETQSKRLQNLQNRDARIIMNMSNDTDHSVAMQALGWKTLKVERRKAKAKMMYKLLNNMGPQSLTNLFTYKGEMTSYNLRNISSTLCLPAQRRTNNLKNVLCTMPMEYSFGILFLRKLKRTNHFLPFGRKSLLTLIVKANICICKYIITSCIYYILYFILQGPVVQKSINANLGLNLLNLGLNFNPRLLCVVQS
jgi:hypothetical protein